MKCREIYREENEAIAERFELSMERIREICSEEMADKNFEEYFKRTAKFICRMEKLVEKIENDWLKTASEEELKEELKKYDSDDIFIIGGESIYDMMYEYCDTAHVTKIDYAYQADKYFPNLDDKEDWVITADSDEQTYFDLEYYFYKYENKNPKSL